MIKKLVYILIIGLLGLIPSKAIFIPPINVITPSGGCSGTVQVFLTSGTTWDVDTCFNSSNNTIETVGAGGSGGGCIDRTTNLNGGGGGGVRILKAHVLLFQVQ